MERLFEVEEGGMSNECSDVRPRACLVDVKVSSRKRLDLVRSLADTRCDGSAGTENRR